MTSQHKFHEPFIRRCLALAESGIPNAFPNPLVGSVIVHEGRIISEGYHQKYGEGHAEVNAVAGVKDHSILPECTIYVSLEPCAHHGKTPPCANLILDKGIKKVVVCNRDPFPLVDGKGVERLQENGVEVILGVLEDEGYEMNRKFFTFHEKKRPYISLKWAQTADGFMDPGPREAGSGPVWITQPETKTIVHKWRSEHMAILVGSNTAITDDPSLTVREYPGKDPVRIILDPNLRVPSSAKLLSDGVNTIVFNNKVDRQDGTVRFIQVSSDRFLEDTLDNCFDLGLQSILIEGGANTLQRFIDAGLWDEAFILTGASHFHSGLNAPKLNGTITRDFMFGKDHVQILRNR